MESATKLATVQVLLTTPDYDWERIGYWVAEGPATVKRAGKIYLTYSASATGACYCMGMLSIDEEDDIRIFHCFLEHVLDSLLKITSVL